MEGSGTCRRSLDASSGATVVVEIDPALFSPGPRLILLIGDLFESKRQKLGWRHAK